MAYDNGEKVAPNSSYQLGEYEFEVQNVVSEGERVIQAHMTGPEGSAAHGITVPTSYRFIGWSVEANETEATVYASIDVPIGESKEWDVPGLNEPVYLTPVQIGDMWNKYNVPNTVVKEVNGIVYAFVQKSETVLRLILCSSDRFSIKVARTNGSYESTIASGTHTYQGQTAYVSNIFSGQETIGWPWEVSAPQSLSIANAATLAITGGHPKGTDYATEERLVGRFAINLGTAGGYPGGDWDEPGDWNEDPHQILHVNVTGALSGRHNDPLYDSSYSYKPADKKTVKKHGSGGDGGHGGGGGAGASTVIINKFATSKADSIEATALARRHGYGSGGGKGGKGGDGIILIYY